MKVLVVGTVSNVGHVINREVQKVLRAVEPHAQVEFYLVESDSTDSTVKELTRIRTDNKRFEFVSLGNLSQDIVNRVERIRFCRNNYIHFIRSSHQECGWDFIIVADLDGMNRKLSCRGVGTSFSSTLEWSGCFANQKKGYYDLYALRCKNWVSENIFSEYQLLI